MILAAADWGAEKPGTQPPRLLSQYLQILRFRALPRAGGLLDQPAGLLDKMACLWDVSQAFYAYEHDGKKPGEVAKWKRDNPASNQLIKRVKELRKVLTADGS